MKSAPSLIAQFGGKKNPYIWDQDCLIWAFWDWNLKIILSYLKLVPSDLPNYKVSHKIKNLKFGTKNGIFGYPGAEI